MNIVKDYRNFALSKGLGSSQIDSQEKQQVSNLAGTHFLEWRGYVRFNGYDCGSVVIFGFC